jgi:hypothetical protein
MADLIPCSLSEMTDYPQYQRALTLPGHAQGVYIMLHPDAVDDIAAKIEGWFEGRPEVEIVDVGVSDKRGLGFLLIEWIACEIDPLFLAILRDEETVADYTTYGRTLEG